MQILHINQAHRTQTLYTSDESMRLDVRLGNETVRLTQSQMGELLGCSTDNVGQHLKTIYASEELSREATRKDFFPVRSCR